MDQFDSTRAYESLALIRGGVEASDATLSSSTCGLEAAMSGRTTPIRTVTTAEYAKAVGVSVSTVKRMIADGKLNAVWVDNAYQIPFDPDSLNQPVGASERDSWSAKLDSFGPLLTVEQVAEFLAIPHRQAREAMKRKAIPSVDHAQVNVPRVAH